MPQPPNPDILVRAMEPSDLPDITEARNQPGANAGAYIDSISMARLRR
ncbi:hypothetical protein [Phenylobacterium sp.]